MASCSDVDSKCGIWYLNAAAGEFGADGQSAFWAPELQPTNDFIYVSQQQQQQQQQSDEFQLPTIMHQQAIIDFPIDEQQQQQKLFVGGLPAGFSSSPLAYLTPNTDVTDCSAYLLPPADVLGACQPDDNETDAPRHLLAATRVAAAMAATATSASTSSAMLPSLSSSSSLPSSTTSPASKPVGRGQSRKTLTKAASTPFTAAEAALEADAILLKPAGEPKVKTPMMVAKRNARERRRVEAVNLAFAKLRKYIPYEKRNKRLSKVKTLRITIDYIRLLEQVLNELDSGMDIAASSNYQNLLHLATRKEVVVPQASV